MQNYKVQWTQDGRKRESQVSYDKPSAEDRKVRLEKQDDVSDVIIVPVAP
ncbi:hypothetical protein [Streptomyces sp. NPDC088707]